MMAITKRQMERLKAIRVAMDAAGSFLTDVQALESLMLYREWMAPESVAAGDIRRYEDMLYRCVQPHTTQADWSPDKVPALWTRVSVEEWPEWTQPGGAHDAYAKGAKASHKEQHWISAVDANVWEPGAYGWDRA